MRPVTLGSPASNRPEDQIAWIIKALRQIELASKQGAEETANDITVSNLTERFELDVATATATQTARRSAPTLPPSSAAVSAASKIEVRPAEGEADIVAIYELLMNGMAPEMALFPPDPVATIGWVIDVVNNGAAFVALLEGEKLIGTIGFRQRTFEWAPDHPFLGEHWLYVSPEHRDGIALRGLLNEVKMLERVTGMRALMARPTTIPG